MNIFNILTIIMLILFGYFVIANFFGGRSSQSQLEAMLGGDVILIDVRSEREFNGGHIPGAINIPLGQLQTEIQQIATDKSQDIVVYCQTGNRSNQALGLLNNMGYENVENLGGIIAWQGEIVRN